MKRAIFEKCLTAVNVAVVIFLIYMLARPTGPIGAMVAGYRQNRRDRALVANNGSTLKHDGAVLTSGVKGGGWIVEFTDYQCPICRTFASRLDLIQDKDSLAVTIRHFPLPIHAMAEGAAKAAICAEEQGRFSAMHRRLFTASEWQEDGNWVREAVAAGVPDTITFSRCLVDEKTAARLKRDIDFGNQLQVNGTPTLFTAQGRILGIPADSVLHSLARSTSGR